MVQFGSGSGSGSDSGSGSGSSKPSIFQMYKVRIIVSALAVGVAVLMGVVWLVARRRRKIAYRRSLHGLAPKPAPMRAMPTHHVTGYGAGRHIRIRGQLGNEACWFGITHISGH